MIGRRRVVAALLVPFGVVASHLLAYAVAHRDADGAVAGVPPHGHLGPLAIAAAVFLGIAFVASGRAGSRGENLMVSPARLAVLQGAVFTAMELAEHGAHGAAVVAALAEPTLLIGLGVQVFVAIAATLFLRLGHEVGVLLARKKPGVVHCSAVVRWIGFAAGVVPPIALSPVSRRGPPLVTAG